MLQQLGRSGYTIALDDYDGRPDIEDLLGLCSIVKVNVAGLDDAELHEAIAPPQGARRAARRHRRERRRREFERCRALGFSYFQGEFFAKPRVIRHRASAPAASPRCGRWASCAPPDAGFDDLERIISSDVGLSLKLLRYVNSAFFALPRTIGSVREALALLGTRTVRRWAMVMAHVGPPRRAARAHRDRPAPRAHVRDARRQRAARGARDPLHHRPLLRRRRRCWHAPMEEVLDSLPFSEEIRAALLRHEGPKGELLDAVIAYERGEFPALPVRRCHRPPPPAGPSGNGVMSLAGAYRAALEWADEAGRSSRGLSSSAAPETPAHNCGG